MPRFTENTSGAGFYDNLTCRTSEDDKSTSVPAIILEGSGRELLLDQLSMFPLHIHGDWLDPSSGLDKRLTLPISFPSGIDESIADVAVVDSGNVLELKLPWPVPLFNQAILCASYIEDEQYLILEKSPEVLAPEKSLKHLRTEVGKPTMLQGKPS